MSFARYPKYKPSGVEWLGDVPEHWEVTALKRLAQTITDGAHISPETAGGAFPFVSTKDVQADAIDFENCLRTSPATYEYMVKTGCRPYVGDVLFSKDGTIGRTVVVREDREFVVASSLIIIRPDGRILSPNFLNALCQSSAVRGQVDSFVKGAGLPRLSIQNLLKVVGCFPPLAEQTAIAAFLDRETGKIDALVAEQRRLMELLKEKRQAVISHAVTRGLNPKAKLKPSGIEWLGEVPEHWEVKRIKNLCSIISKGTTPTTIGADFTNDGIRFLKAENITEAGVSSDPDFYISGEAHKMLSRSSLADGDVLVVIAGATTGKSAVLGAELLPANTNQAVSFIRPQDRRLSPFISLWLGTRFIRNLILLNSVQSAQPNLSMEDLGNVPIPIPPPYELGGLLTYLNCELAKFDTLTAEAQRAIDLLQERRTALISAAVTGQIDVRGLAASSS